MNRGIAAAGGVVALGGLLMGVLPLPLDTAFGCPAAFASAPAWEQSIEVVVACEEIRADRQNVALGLIVVGLGAAAGAALHTRRT